MYMGNGNKMKKQGKKKVLNIWGTVSKEITEQIRTQMTQQEELQSQWLKYGAQGSENFKIILKRD